MTTVRPDPSAAAAGRWPSSASLDRGEAALGGTHGRVILIRHGQTECNTQDRFCGAHEGELTDAGLRMARHAAQHPALTADITVVSSPAQRARRTAEMIAAMPERRLFIDERLRELSYGQWEHLRPSDITETQALQQWLSDPALYAPPGGETALDVMARVVAAVRDAVYQHGTVALVSHKTSIRLALAFFLGLSPARFRDIDNIEVSSFSELSLANGRATLKRLGDISHLPQELAAKIDLATHLASPITAQPAATKQGPTPGSGKERGHLSN